MYPYVSPYEAQAAPRVQVQPLLRRVYAWMTLGMLTTATSAYLTVSLPPVRALLGSPFLLFGALVLELILVIALSAAVWRLSAGAAVATFLVYAALNGFTLSLIVLYFSLGTLTLAFAVTASLFAALTLVGLTTRADLTRLGTYLFVGLIALLVALLVNLFLRSSTFDLVISVFGVMLFTGLAAYDTQRIQRLASDPRIQGQGDQLLTKLSILGALSLYLDFLNLFLFVLRLVGRRES